VFLAFICRRFLRYVAVIHAILARAYLNVSYRLSCEVLLCNVKQNICVWIQDERRKAALISIDVTFFTSLHKLQQFRLQNKIGVAFLANALSTSFVGPCSRWHCSKRSAFSRSYVMVERIDVSVRCNLAKMRSDSDIVTISVPMICTQQSVGASTSYKRWSKCTMEKYGGGGLQPFFRNLIGKISLL